MRLKSVKIKKHPKLVIYCLCKLVNIVVLLITVVGKSYLINSTHVFFVGQISTQ